MKDHTLELLKHAYKTPSDTFWMFLGVGILVTHPFGVEVENTTTNSLEL